MPGVAAETNPFVALRTPFSDWMVSAPEEEIDVVPVAPNAAALEENMVEDAPPLNERSVVVAFDGKR